MLQTLTPAPGIAVVTGFPDPATLIRIAGLYDVLLVKPFAEVDCTSLLDKLAVLTASAEHAYCVQHGLSPSHARILALRASGFRRKQVAAELGVKDGTIARHEDEIRARTGCDSIAEVIAAMTGRRRRPTPNG